MLSGYSRGVLCTRLCHALIHFVCQYGHGCLLACATLACVVASLARVFLRCSLECCCVARSSVVSCSQVCGKRGCECRVGPLFVQFKVDGLNIDGRYHHSLVLGLQISISSCFSALHRHPYLWLVLLVDVCKQCSFQLVISCPHPVGVSLF